MRSPHSLAVVFVIALVAAGCRTAAPDQPATETPAPTAATAPTTREPWPPPEARLHAARQHDPNAKTVRLVPKEGGWTVLEMLDTVAKTTGCSFLYSSYNQTFRQAKIEFVGAREIEQDQLFDWLQAALSNLKLVLVPIGPNGINGETQWVVMDQADPNMKSHPVYVAEDDLADFADRDGLYIVTLLRVRDTADTTRVRNALSPLSTQTAGIGRVQDVPGGRTLIVGDFAPVVWSMKQLLDRMNVLADTPQHVEPQAPKAAK